MQALLELPAVLSDMSTNYESKSWTKNITSVNIINLVDMTIGNETDFFYLRKHDNNLEKLFFSNLRVQMK